MKVAIDVKNRDEANALRTAMADPAMRAMVLIVGTLLQLPSSKMRGRVLGYVKDRLDEEQGASEEAPK